MYGARRQKNYPVLISKVLALKPRRPSEVAHLINQVLGWAEKNAPPPMRDFAWLEANAPVQAKWLGELISKVRTEEEVKNEVEKLRNSRPVR